MGLFMYYLCRETLGKYFLLLTAWYLYWLCGAHISVFNPRIFNKFSGKFLQFHKYKFDGAHHRLLLHFNNPQVELLDLKFGGKAHRGNRESVSVCICTSPNWIINLISRFSLFAVFYFNKQKHCHSKAYKNPPKFIKLESLAFSSAAAWYPYTATWRNWISMLYTDTYF